MFPCRLRRQNCLVGAEFAKSLALQPEETMSTLQEPRDILPSLSKTSESRLSIIPIPDTAVTDSEPAPHHATLSRFEHIFTSYPPIIDSLIAQLPTASILDLYHTSRHWRDFLRIYPLAWKTLSFRLPQPAAGGGPGNETPDNRERQSKLYNFDALLIEVIRPCGTRLTSLDLCNTNVTGIELIGSVVNPCIDSLQHLSVRGCKHVSIKYHIVPFLGRYITTNSPWGRQKLALKSLYTYRARHHRRRPYLPSSLARRDSDSDPTHQLIEICHQLGIWTDTAWCPTPGGRCFRRKDYHAGRAGPQNMEVWVPFDRLWRSSNRIGPVEGTQRLGQNDGRLWEIEETGYEGEPLGPENGVTAGEGKHVPAHLRRSHRAFVENIQCTQCKEVVLERCESCSVRMHCMGCRKTLCASCAFNRPIPKKRVRTRHFTNLALGLGPSFGASSSGNDSSASLAEQNRASKPEPPNKFWWAPGATRSPNLMNENVNEDDSSDSEDGGNLNGGLPIPPANRDPPKLNMHWCCLEPIFSGGGGIAVLGTGLGGRGADKIRAAPLPQTKEYQDPDFLNQLRPVDYVREMKNNGLYEYVLGEDVDILSYLKQESLDLQANICPRGLCQDCYRTFRWKVSCRACKTPICKEHDFRALKFRKCGYRDMHTEREFVQSYHEPPQLIIPEFNPNKNGNNGKSMAPTTSSSIDPAESGAAATDEAPLSRSQILIPTSTPSAATSSAAPPLPQNPATDLFSSSTSIPFVPVSSGRPRSLSASGLRSRNSASWSNSSRALQPSSITNPPPLPCTPRHPVQWEGCGAYFCQYPRPVGDHRPQCVPLKECSYCAVLVCDSCVAANPPCTCSFCKVTYHCPVCSRKPEVRSLCRLEDELLVKAELERRLHEKRERDKEDRGQADQVADAALEFWVMTGLVWEGLVGGQEEAEDGPEAVTEAEPPLTPNPDSITVTMEFGVSEEPNNVTTVTAGPAAGPPAVQQEQGYHEVVEGPDSQEPAGDEAPLPSTSATSLPFVEESAGEGGSGDDDEGTQDADLEDEDGILDDDVELGDGESEAFEAIIEEVLVASTETAANSGPPIAVSTAEAMPNTAHEII
ncbi:uncharacterized protein EI97DRAFT_401852 [Westerdykella ornata]|uniref:Uncharacterized protein n=1 Tax=Westerdykella ornata TaxID=318751 RepID=A0A6A6JFG5_WESOR|nr:uncharacterized protein EI97DRAFT_401852 [Westerdykella ornata]KAF2274738.1 hypothetical protein EI97DRAFT_401852 [Westerdykella ornata]